MTSMSNKDSEDDRPTSKYLPQGVLNNHTNPVRAVGNPTEI